MTDNYIVLCVVRDEGNMKKTIKACVKDIDKAVVIDRMRDVDIKDLLWRKPIELEIGNASSYLKGQSVLVTGGGGSIGSELCRQIAIYKPERLLILDNNENNAYEIQEELLYLHPFIELSVIIANIREKQRLEDIFEMYKPNVVFHAAAHKHVPLMELNPGEAIKNNVFGTLNVAECSEMYGARKLVLISTDKAVNPTSVMGASKRIAEMIVQGINSRSTTEFTAVRFGNVLGSSGSVIPLFKKQIEHGGPVKVTHPEVTRFFMTISEAVQLVIEAGAMAKGGEIFMLDMGDPVRIYDLAHKYIRLCGFEPEIDIKIEFSGLRPGEKLHEELLLADEGIHATRNNKIFVVKSKCTEFDLLKSKLVEIEKIDMNNADSIISFISELVPNYQGPV